MRGEGRYEGPVSAEGPAPVGGVAGAVRYQPHPGLHGDRAVGCLLGRLPGPTRGGGRGSRARPRSGQTSWESSASFVWQSILFFFPLPSLGASIFPSTF